MAEAYFPLAEETGRRNVGIVQHVIAMLVGFGLGCVMIYAAGGQPLAVVLPADNMAAPMSLASPTVTIAADRLKAHGINPGPLGMIALTAIDANNRGTGMRQVATMAMSMPQTSKMLSRASKEVSVRAEALKKEEMAGITPPFGFFDPVGFSTDCDGAQLAFLREAELKHGRMGMVASLGLIAGEKFSPLLGATDTTTPGSLLVGKTLPGAPAQFWGAVLVAVTFLELFMINSQQWTEGREAGDFGWDPMGMKPKKPEDLLALQNKELNNGRLAMLGAAGIVAQEMVTGKKIF